MKITLNILKQDIIDNKYADTNTCAITRAFARAGYPHFKDMGYHVKNTIHGSMYQYSDKDTELGDMVINMQTYIQTSGADREGVPPEDFTWTLDLDMTEISALV